jgi:hypothetical protein
MRLFANSFSLSSVGSEGLRRAAIEVGAFLNGQSFVIDVAHDMCLRLEHHVAALNGPLHSTIHNHLLSSDASDNSALRRNNERSAMQVALYLTIDLD